MTPWTCDGEGPTTRLSAGGASSRAPVSRAGIALLIIGAIVVGVSLGSWLVRTGRPASQHALVIEPAVLDLTSQRRSDQELLRADFTVRNSSKETVTISGITVSCTCTTVLPAGQREPPFHLAPGAATSIGVVTNLASRFGPQSYGISITSRIGERPLPTVEGRIELVVDSPLLPYPSLVDAGPVIPDTTLTKRVLLGDTLDSNDTRVLAVSTTDACNLAAEVRPIEEVIERGKGYTLKSRFAIDVVIRGDGTDSNRHEVVRLRLSDGRKLQIPVTWSVRQPVVVSPREVLVAGVAPGEWIERDVFVTLADGEASAPRVIEQGDGVEARVETFGTHRWRLRITFAAPAASDEPWSKVVLVTGDSGRAISIPIIVRSE